MKNKRLNFYILLTSLGFIVIIAAGLFMFSQFRRIIANHDHLSQSFYNEYIESTYKSNLENMADYIEAHYPVLRDVQRLKDDAGTGWLWEIAEEWHEIAQKFNFAYIYYIEKNNDNYIFLASSGIRQNQNPEWLGGPVWFGPPPAFIEEAWETKQTTFSPEPTVNEWGTLISVERPILSNGRIVGILGIDYDISFLDRLARQESLLREQKSAMLRKVAVILAVPLSIIFAIIGLMIWFKNTSILVSARQKEADERTEILLDAMPIGCTMTDNNYNLIACNNEVEKMFGLKNKRDFLDRFFEYSPENQPDGQNSKEKAFSYFRKAFKDGYANVEWMHLIDGELIPCDVTLVRVVYQGEFVLAGYMKDLREIKASAARIKEAQESKEANKILENILNSIDVFIYATVPDTGEILFVNKCMKTAFGKINDDLTGKYCYEIFRNRDDMCEFCPCFKLRENPEQVIIWDEYDENFGSYIRHSDCNIDWPNGEKVHMQYAVDVTEIEKRGILLNTINQAASILLQSEGDNFGEDLQRCMGMIGKAVNSNRVCIWQNHVHEGRLHCTQIYEWLSSAEPQTDRGITANVPYDETLPGWEETLSQGECINTRVRDMGLKEQAQLSKLGILSLFVVPVFIHDAFWGYVGYDNCEDERLYSETEQSILRSGSLLIANALIRNEMNENLRDTAAQLEIAVTEARSANEAKSNFLAKMSHEIRTPMNAILGIAEIQLQNEDILPTTQEALDRIYNSGYLLLGIINEILDLSKIESGRMELVPVKYDVPSLINDTTQLIKTQFDSKPIELKLEVDENIPVFLFGDELRIKQILNNLLSNAFKYSDEGEVVLSVGIEPPPDAKDDERITIVFRVSDTGQGLSPEQVEKLFDEYSRFNLEANRTTVGTGLGMNITRHLIRLMGGDISVESEQGKGSTFTVRLPQAAVGDSVLGRELTDSLQQLNFRTSTHIKKAPQIIREYMPYGNVLIVDDVETNLFVAKGLLAPYGMSVKTAASGYEAIDMIKGALAPGGNAYDIIFMDHFMPRMDGIEATKIIRELGYTQPVIALTANALSGQAEVFKENGFDGFISKPIDIRQLNATLNKLVRDKQPPDVIEAARQQKEHLNENADFSGEDKAFLHEKLLAIQTACAARDKKNGKEALVAIKKKAWPRPVKDLLNNITEHLLNTDFEGAMEAARQYLEKH